MTAYFVTSSGTGVGKTFTSCALLHAACKAGGQAQAFKPIISGWEEGAATDTAQLIAAGGHRQSRDAVSPWRFLAPLSPHRAAALEGQRISLPALVDWSQQQLARAEGLTLVEGVGGVMVPLDEQHTVLDWMVALHLPVILVVGSYLGAISHTLTALSVLRAAGLHVAALVMNESAESAVSFAEAQAGLAPFITTIPLQIFQPRVSSWQEAEAIAALAGQL